MLKFVLLWLISILKAIPISDSTSIKINVNHYNLEIGPYTTTHHHQGIKAHEKTSQAGLRNKISDRDVDTYGCHLEL